MREVCVPTLSSGAALLLTGWNSLAHVAANGGSPGAAALALYLVVRFPSKQTSPALLARESC